MAPREESLLVPVTRFIAEWHNGRVVQILPLLTVLGITSGIGTGPVGLTVSQTLILVPVGKCNSHPSSMNLFAVPGAIMEIYNWLRCQEQLTLGCPATPDNLH